MLNIYMYLVYIIVFILLLGCFRFFLKYLKLTCLCLAIGIIIIAIIAIVIVKNYEVIEVTVPTKDFLLSEGAVVSNGGPCAQIGMNILKKYGNAVDSIIATMVCDGVTTMNNMGIGGGFVATIYIKSERKGYSLNARETAPAASTVDMYHHNQTWSRYGGLSVAVPGEIRGYWEMYQKFGGKASWSELFEPTIELCKNGVPINKHIATNIASYTASIKQSSTLYSILKKPDGSLPKEGDKVRLPKLAETLSQISKVGPDALYTGNLSSLLIDDITAHGGIMTLEDLANYSVRWEEPVIVPLKNGSLKMYSVPEPASGSILGFSLSVLEGMLPVKLQTKTAKKSSDSVPSTVSSPIPNLNDTFVITEAFKYAYAIRSRMGDPHFHNISEVIEKITDPKILELIRDKLNVNITSNDTNSYGADSYKEDHGTANMVVLAPNGDAVVATSTVNLIFGSKLVSEQTGIILNDEMDDFSAPGIVNTFGIEPSTSNFIYPGARPQSSMCPSIFVNSSTGEVILAVGAAGGTRITTATALVALRTLWYDINLQEAIKMPRFHHQLQPMIWFYDPSFDKEIVDGMAARGHITKQGNSIDSCVTGILIKDQLIEASSDLRRPGNVSFLYPIK